MLFSRVALFALPAIAAAMILPRDYVCHQGTTQTCCNQLQKADTLSSDQKKLVTQNGGQLDNAVGQFGFACTPIAAAPLANSVAGCKSYNVCCQNTTATGVVAMNCSPIIV